MQKRPERFQWPSSRSLVALFFVLFAFNSVTFKNLQIEPKNSIEAGFFWPDEGRHIRMLETIQTTGSWKLEQQSYTSLYVQSSYGLAFLIHGFQKTPIPSETFALASKIVSLLSMNLFLLLFFGGSFWIFQSEIGALFTMILLAGQQLNMAFNTLMHPEAIMLAFVALALFLGIKAMESSSNMRFLYGMALASAISFGAKPQTIFLFGWELLWFTACHYRWKTRSFIKIGTQGLLCLGFSLFGFLIASPHQALHPIDFFHGMLSEQQRAQTLWEGKSLWNWWNVLISDQFLGPVFLPMVLLLTLYYGGWQFMEWKKKKSFPKKEHRIAIAAAAHFSWMIIGGGYILLTSRSFIDRYLIHIQASMLLMMVFGLYALWHSAKPRPRQGVFAILILLILIGIQGQWHNAQRRMNYRWKLYGQLPEHRRFYEELKQWIPSDAVLFFSKKTYLLTADFPKAIPFPERFGWETLREQKVGYLVLHQDGRTFFRKADDILNTVTNTEIHQTIDFWRTLAAKTPPPGFQITVLKEDQALKITIYKIDITN